MKFDLQELSCLIAVANERSFTHAAAALHMTQPALSRKISELESRLGVTLLERTTRMVRLTKAGQQLNRYAQTILETCAEAEDAMSRFSASERHAIEIGYGSRAQFNYMLQLIDRMHDIDPEQRISVSHGMTYERLYLGQLDAALLMAGTISGLDWVDYILLDNGGLSVFFPRGMFPKERRSLSIEDLRGYPLIFPEPHISERGVPFISLHELIRRELLRHHLDQEQFHSGTGPEDFCSRILSEHLLGIMPDSSRVLNNDLIDSLPIRECRSGFSIALAWNRSDSDTPAMKFLRGAAEFISKRA